MGDEKIDPDRIRRILSRAFAQNPTALDLITYRFGLEKCEAKDKINRERSFEDIAMLLGIEGSDNVEELLNAALRDLRGH